MITLPENVIHQLTIVGTGLIAEAQAGNVDLTGYQLLTLPDVIDHGDGSFTLSVAVPVEAPKKASRSKISDRQEVAFYASVEDESATE